MKRQQEKIRRPVMKRLLWSFHPGGAYCSAWDLCSCALLQLDNNRHYSIISEVIGCLFQWFYSKKNNAFIPQGIRSNNILTGERGLTVKRYQEIQVKGDFERTTYKYLQILKTIIFYLLSPLILVFFQLFSKKKTNTFEMTMSLIV